MRRVDSQSKSPTDAAQGVEAPESGNTSDELLVALDGVGRAFRGSDGREWRALDRVSVRVARGEFLVVTGPSGSGKSTLLSLVGMLDRPSEGRLWFDGRSVEQASDRELARLRRDIGFVFQEPALLAGLSLLDNLAYPLIPRGVPAGDRRNSAGEWLARVGLSGLENKLPHELSGGERQRATVARALCGSPRLVVADEPTSSLDSASAGIVIRLLQGFHAKGGTLVVATHDPLLVALGTRVVELGGRERSPSNRN